MSTCITTILFLFLKENPSTSSTTTLERSSITPFESTTSLVLTVWTLLSPPGETDICIQIFGDYS